MKPTVLIRTRFPHDILERLDALAAQVGSAIKRRVPRAALVRALVRRGLDAPVAEIVAILDGDAIKRGRSAKGGHHDQRR